jgi:hypothetical protein
MTVNNNIIVYNVTFKVLWKIADAWLEWQKNEHIPAHLATGSFDDYKIYRLLDQDEEEGPTFIIQYFTDSEERYQDFLIASAPALQQQAWGKWGEGFIAFRTLMRQS